MYDIALQRDRLLSMGASRSPVIHRRRLHLHLLCWHPRHPPPRSPLSSTLPSCYPAVSTRLFLLELVLPLLTFRSVAGIYNQNRPFLVHLAIAPLSTGKHALRHCRLSFDPLPPRSKLPNRPSRLFSAFRGKALSSCCIL